MQDRMEIIAKYFNGDDPDVEAILDHMCDALEQYEKFTEKGVKSSCTKCRKAFQNVKKSVDVVRKKILESKKAVQ